VSDTAIGRLIFSCMATMMVGVLALDYLVVAPRIQSAVDRVEKAVELLDLERQKDAERVKMFEGARRIQEKQEAELLRLQYQAIKAANEHLKAARELDKTLEDIKSKLKGTPENENAIRAP
jgi:hypothetical protein